MDLFVSSSIPVSVQPPFSNRASDDSNFASSSSSAVGPTEQDSSRDRVNLSPEAQEAFRRDNSTETAQETTSSPKEQGLTEEELRQLQDLKIRDREVRTHEQAHLSTAGRYAAGSASFTYQQGPDGTKYAIGGEVPIDISKGATPEETIQKMSTVRAAALAPAEPSAADRQIAAQAAMFAAEARQEIVMAGQAEQKNTSNTDQEEQESIVEPGENDVQNTTTSEISTTRRLTASASVSRMINAYTSLQP